MSAGLLPNLFSHPLPHPLNRPLHLHRPYLPETTKTIFMTTETNQLATTTLSLTIDPTPLILAGDGYQLTISPEAEAQKLKLLARAAKIVIVTSNDLSADAQFEKRQLAAMRIAVEKSRKEIKEPVNRIGKLIDSTAADFMADITAEEKRIDILVGNHATEVERLKRIKEQEERRAFDDARRARDAALAAQEAADAAKANHQGIAAVLEALAAARAAEDARVQTLATRMDASADLAGTKVAEGVRFAWDFEVSNLDLLATTRRGLVTIEPRRAAILEWLKAAEARGDAAGLAEEIGILAYKKPIVSSR